MFFFVSCFRRWCHICQQDMIYINIKLFLWISVRKTLETPEILPFQGFAFTPSSCLFYMNYFCMWGFARVSGPETTSRSPSRNGRRRLSSVCDSDRKTRPRRRAQRARGRVWTSKSSISNHAGLRGIKKGKRSRRSLHSTAAFVHKWKLQLWLRMHGYFTGCFFQHFCLNTHTETNSYRWNCFCIESCLLGVAWAPMCHL